MTSPAPPPNCPLDDTAAPASQQDDERRLPRHRPSKYVFARTLFTEPVLVVTRDAEPQEAAGSVHGVFDRRGNRLGHVVDMGRGFMRRAARLLPRYAHYVTRRFEIQDANHSAVLKVTRPAKAPRTRSVVARPDETPIGEVILNDTADEGQFTLFANGDPIATVHLASHSGDAVIRTTAGLEIARVGQPSTSISPTNGNTYVVEIPEHLPEPLASMVLAIALTPDTTLGH